ncbi:Xaa-Pro peptidase family protein [Rhizobium sp.]|uniref:Xaa-Pro peptidase family protein n=1 Tax=Rhizobium sp. TaxID=391 RepID=UPI000E9C5906|nr:aminopeptidase P family protein [Rhizobium sp.]
MSDVNRVYAERLLREAELEALVVFQPEAFRYVVGAPAGVATMWGRAGAAIALVPADASKGLAAIASDHAAGAIRAIAPDMDLRTHRIWIDMVDLRGAETLEHRTEKWKPVFGKIRCENKNLDQINTAYQHSGSTDPRPETFDRATCFGLLSELLTERGLHQAHIGVDLEFMPAADFEALKQAIPAVTWLDGSQVLRRMRAVKSEREITRLRNAARAAEAGLVRMASEVKLGASIATFSAAWKDGALNAAREAGFSLSGHWDFISVGADLSDSSAIVTPGALIKADVGTLVDGYSSDGARTFTYGSATSLAHKVFAALETAFAAGLEQLKPGNTFGSVHAAMQASMRKDGFLHYDRGHFGHSVGGGAGIEDWPFFSSGNQETILPNMVVALEAPFYGQGLGALMIEDQFLITDSSAECMNTLPRTLRDLSLR